MAISYVADASWSSGSSGTSSFTLIKPSGTTSGDYMVAIVAIDTSSSGGDRTITPPSGWTSQGHKYASPYCVVDVMTGAAGASEPGSWTGSLAGTAAWPIVSIVTTYR